MRLEILHVADCPGAAVLAERVTALVGRRPGVDVTYRQVDDEAAAVASGMRGSPTLLVDGVDPFADAGQPPSVSCRLYRGSPGGCPSEDALRAALGL